VFLCIIVGLAFSLSPGASDLTGTHEVIDLASTAPRWLMTDSCPVIHGSTSLPRPVGIEPFADALHCVHPVPLHRWIR
jgi:hypothetical protein